MDKKNIIPGYNGIMPLDLTNVDEKYHSILIKQHYKDIDLYKEEQAKLPKKLRYENTVVNAEKIWKIEEEAQKRRKELLIKQRDLEYQKKIELYYKYSK